MKRPFGRVVLSTVCATLSVAPAGAAPAVFELRLSIDAANALSASLSNRSSADQWVLIDPDVQAIRPTLTRVGGEVLGGMFDERSNRKFDNAPYKSLWRLVRAGQTVKVGEGRFWRTAEGDFAFGFAPYLMAGLQPGCYDFSARWESRIDEWVGDDARPVKVRALWKGGVESNTVRACLR